MNTSKVYSYSICHPGDMCLPPFTDEIIVIVKSGEPGGGKGEFEEFIKGSLLEWYDCAKVEIID